MDSHENSYPEETQLIKEAAYKMNNKIHQWNFLKRKGMLLQFAKCEYYQLLNMNTYY